MMQVNELMELIDRRRLDGVVVASNFLFRRVQPCNDRIHPAYEWRGDQDPTREVPEKIDRDKVLRCLDIIFQTRGWRAPQEQQKIYNLGHPPPAVSSCLLSCITINHIAMNYVCDLMVGRSVDRIGRCTS
jgi:hypothetical protein